AQNSSSTGASRRLPRRFRSLQYAPQAFSRDGALEAGDCVMLPANFCTISARTGRFSFMAPIERRRFLQQSLAVGAGCSAELLLSRLLKAQTPAADSAAAVRIYLDTRRTIAPIDRNLFGSFL